MMNINNRSQRGQALILIVLAIVGLVGLTTLAIDGGNAFMDRRHAQGAADAAALAKINSQDYAAVALALASQNGYNNDGVNNTVTVNVPPSANDCNPGDVANPYVGNNQYIQVIIHSTLATYFAPVVGIEQTNSCVEAIAHAKPAHTEPMFSGNAMVSLNPHDCSAFKVHGTSDTIVVGSSVFVNSDSDCVQGAFNQNGNGGLVASNLCVVGSSRYDLGQAPTPTLCSPVPYPPNIIFPSPTCSASGTLGGGIITPRNIPASWLSGNVTLQPGVYCISGNATINAQDHLSGDGVLLYFVDGGIHMDGNAQVNLNSPQTGLYAGLLIYLPMTNDSSVILMEILTPDLLALYWLRHPMFRSTAQATTIHTILK
jgi:Flp pilus assembly protein TadG